jgi:hypothetical protein
MARTPGALNYATRELKYELNRFFSSEEYRDSVKTRIVNGSAPTIELYFLQLLYGKPRENVSVAVHVDDDYSNLSTAQLAERAQELLARLHEAEELERQIAPYIEAQRVDASQQREVVDAASPDAEPQVKSEEG